MQDWYILIITSLYFSNIEKELKMKSFELKIERLSFATYHFLYISLIIILCPT